MQPYFLPYLGYFQLIAAADVFVVYDNIQYTKQGWINRNRLLRKDAPATFSLPLRQASDYLDVREREIAADFRPQKLLDQFDGAYRKAPQFQPTFAMLERVVTIADRNLFRYLHQSISAICTYVGIGTPIRISSEVPADHALRKQDRVISLCRALGASRYVNPAGGVELYSKAEFLKHSIELEFIRSRPVDYAQFGATFVPALSIIDVLMFNPIETVRDWISSGYDLV